MSSYNYGIGKGLREPCSPYRNAYFFGAEFNSVNADDWNCLPEITEPTMSFDLTGVTVNHEVVVALFNISDKAEGVYRFTFRWFRARDDALIHREDWSSAYPGGISTYSYSYVGYTYDELSENGRYYVVISIRGPANLDYTIHFKVVGISEVEPEPEPVPSGAGAIVEAFNLVSAFFYAIYLEVFDWVWPFSAAAPLFYEVSSLFSSIAWGLSGFFTWVDEVAAKASAALSWDTIWSYILSYIPNLVGIRDWFYSVTTNVLSIVDSWWSSTTSTVQGWITEARQLVQDQLGWLTSWVSDIQTFIDELELNLPGLTELLSWFTDWPAHVLSTVNTWWTSTMGDIQGLIDSAFTARDSLWAGWQELRAQVVEFFEDPEQWLYNRLDSFFERFW